MVQAKTEFAIEEHCSFHCCDESLLPGAIGYVIREEVQAKRNFSIHSKISTEYYPPSQKTMGVSPWMNAYRGPFEARRAKEGASADSAEEMKDTMGETRGGFIFASHQALDVTARLNRVV